MAGEMTKSAALYVSWGGTGRAASLREAMRRAGDDERPLRYLALLDDDHFGDLDSSMLNLVRNELTWLLDSQLELTRHQLGVEQLPVSVSVRSGPVIDLIVEEAADIGSTMILIGAPVPVAGHDSIQSLIDQVASRTGAEVSLVLPNERRSTSG